eukprot:5934516-Pleurochrysis_carterae.AAC.4
MEKHGSANARRIVNAATGRADGRRYEVDEGGGAAMWLTSPGRSMTAVTLDRSREGLASFAHGRTEGARGHRGGQ